MTRIHIAHAAPASQAEQGGSNRQGFALAGALLALVVVGALVTGSFFAASQEQSIGLSAKYNDEAMYVAEYGLSRAAGSMSSDQLKAIADTATVPNSPFTVSGGGETIGSASVWVRRLGSPGTYYLFVAKGTATRGGKNGGGTRVLGLMTHLVSLTFPQDRAMQVYGGMNIQGSAQVSGQDAVPTGNPQWDTCAVNSTTQSAIVAKDTSLIDPQKKSSIVGSVVQDPTLNAASFNTFGDMNLAQLEGMATKLYGTINGVNYGMPNSASIGPSATGSPAHCDLSVKDNWGEPLNTVPSCRDYWPLIFVKGDLDLAANGRGQGILIVDGNLSIHGGFNFWGITIITGSLDTYGNGGHLNGTVMTWNTGSLTYDPNLAIGNSLVQLSGCAVRRAVRSIPGANRAVPIRGHSWFDLTAAGAGF